MANDTFLKPSLFVQTLTPQLDEDSFLNFLKAYYEWLQSTKLTFSENVGSFVAGETITGDDTKATAIVKEIASDYLVLKMITDTPFDIKETIRTATASATVLEIKDNVIRAAARQQKNRNADTSVDKYFEYLKSEFNKGFPTSTEINRRFITNKIKDFYKSKSNEDAYKFLFKSIFDLDVEFRYPGEEILRISDGDFEKTILIRAVKASNIFEYLNQTITGRTSGALGNVVDIKATFLGGIEYAELTMKLVSGTFLAGETIEILEDSTANTILYGMVAETTIIDAGSGYTIGDVLTITGDGEEATAIVSSVSNGPITKLKTNAIGHGYRLNTSATVTNTGTGGNSFSLKVTELANTYTVTSGANTYTVGEISKVSIVNRGVDYFKAPTITLDDTIIKSLGLLSENLITIVDTGTDYSVGNTIVFTGGSGANAAGIVASIGNTSRMIHEDERMINEDGDLLLNEDATNILEESDDLLLNENATTILEDGDPDSFYGSEGLLFEDSTRVLQDDSVNGKFSAIKNEEWTNLGPILRIELTNFGTGYTVGGLPTITVTSTTGSTANLIATDIQGNSANVEVDVANNGIGLGAIRGVEIKNFGIDYTTATIDASGSGDGNANIQAIVLGIATSDGQFISDEGKLNVKIVQDSLFFQDFSYVIRSGIGIDAYRQVINQSVHPAGLQFFGEILIASYILVAAKFDSIIFTEHEKIEIAIKQILSFFPGSINPISMAMEKDIELDTISVAHIDENREINVEIAPQVIDQIVTSDGTVDINFELKKDIDIAIDVPISERQIKLELDTISVSHIDEYREINVEIAPEVIDQIVTSDERTVDISIEKNVDVAISAPTILPELDIANLLRINNFNQFDVNNVSFLELNLYTLSNFPISKYQSNALSDIWESYGTIKKNLKIAGTVTITGNTVVGTNTSFDVDFGTNDFIIVGNEKMKVLSIANSAHLTVNVNPSGTYSNVSAHQEVFV